MTNELSVIFKFKVVPLDFVKPNPQPVSPSPVPQPIPVPEFDFKLLTQRIGEMLKGVAIVIGVLAIIGLGIAVIPQLLPAVVLAA